MPEIAHQLSVHQVTVRTWIRSGKLPGIRAGRQYRVRSSDLERFMSFGTQSESRELLDETTLEAELLLDHVAFPDGSRLAP
ncbi:MAG: helix-turn-helix domain-containing protein [Solirubrobacterales bacterium]|nr:helix-turn-helix domain-containing protein [Solirubrobacterales bacterium]